MIEYILPKIKDPADYITALSLFRTETPLTGEEAEKLTGIYQKYGQEGEHQELTALYLAVDILPGRTREDAADFAALNLPENDLNALFQIKDLLTLKEELAQETADSVVSAVTGGELSEPVAFVLARTAVDVLSYSWNFAQMREQAAALAGWLTELGAEKLEQYAILAEEVRVKCRR